jgi:hypothetical protein
VKDEVSLKHKTTEKISFPSIITLSDTLENRKFRTE